MTFNRTRCPHCKGKLESGQRIHPDCIAPWADSLAAKKEREDAQKARAAAKLSKVETTRRKDAIKSRAQWLKEAQTAFNAWVRIRDSGKPCISCGRHHQGQVHAGHYLSTAARPELRFEPLNVHLQCAPCNTYLSGNAVLYRKALIEKIGLSGVEWLEGPHKATHYSIDDLKAIKEAYTLSARAMRRAQE